MRQNNEVELDVNYEIVQLGAKDLSLMRKLLDCFAKAFEEPENYQINQPSDSYLGEQLCSPTFIAIAALAQGTVVGGLAAYELKKFEKERSEIYIYDLAVSKEYRRIGIATALIEALKPIALERKAWVIYVQADFGDEPAIQLYNKLGVEERVLHFDISPTSDA